MGCSPETLRRTNLVDLTAGEMVNMERLVRPRTPNSQHGVSILINRLHGRSHMECNAGALTMWLWTMPLMVCRSLPADGRNSGHMVQGHVDGTGEIVEKWMEGDSLWVRIKAPDELMPYIVTKGYVPLSCSAASRHPQRFSVLQLSGPTCTSASMNAS